MAMMTCVLLNEKGEIIVIVIVLVINVELNLYFRFTLIGSFEMIKFLKLQMILNCGFSLTILSGTYESKVV